ncbi:SGNH/GDSL hydrolase family protein [Lacihabitans sp. LS3-19]|uniref:SGNH/GDSL hydrolase family protein n=1 Tax=Lacihabitans sp. LS3-19 TaxID=2487335 RepID=UPI0020CFE030|nr:SGNH/GDSL hydrolase family protein [Lacihabitans sp. LS3-19]MCP9767324.1 SGNH/GDSL hydrolase family protein [Lacihabitans sp. LS3-19]
MKAFLLFLVLGGLMGSCVKTPVSGNLDTNKFSYLALGDSYTIGESVKNSERWPVQLVAKLKEKNIDFSEPKIIAKTGWTTDELIAAISKESINQKFDMVSLLIGVNNQYRGRSSAVFVEEFKSLLQQAIGFSKNGKKGVFVVSIPDWGVTPFASGRDKESIAKQIDEFNSLSKSVCEKEGIVYVDITDISRIPDPSLIASDGLHPSGNMYAKWVERIFPTIIKNYE